LNRHNAPPVVYPIGRSAFLGNLLLGLWLAGLFLGLWWYHALQLDWRAALASFAVLLAGITARISWTNLPCGQLAWDGDVWQWEGVPYRACVAEHELSVIVDCQHRLLLRLENDARVSMWLWAEQKAMPERWLDFRRAVYSPHRPPAALPKHDFLPAEPSLPSSGVAVSIAMHPVNVPRTKKP
jgi:toxin CptA